MRLANWTSDNSIEVVYRWTKEIDLLCIRLPSRRKVLNSTIPKFAIKNSSPKACVVAWNQMAPLTDLSVSSRMRIAPIGQIITKARLPVTPCPSTTRGKLGAFISGFCCWAVMRVVKMSGRRSSGLASGRLEVVMMVTEVKQEGLLAGG